VSVAACLLPFSFALAVFAPGWLDRLTRPGIAPRWGVTGWLAVIASMVGSWVMAAVFLAADLVAGWRDPGRLVLSCFAALGQVALGGSGSAAQAGLLVVTTAALAALATLGWRWGRSVARARAHTHDHARQARVVGRHVPGLDAAAVVLSAPERAAYCVAGRPSTIVVTSATLAALEEPHLRAVLAHERAHLDGRHHQLIALSRGLAVALPRVRLFTRGAVEIARLLEMCADDAAVRGHGSPTLLGALLALATPTTTPAATAPHTALGAAGVDVLARAQRLATPISATVRRRTQTLLAVIILVAVAGPVLTGSLATTTGLSMCGGAVYPGAMG
jgi:Zn-dependent protease with chaperone function